MNVADDNPNSIFTPGTSFDTAPKGDPERQAIDSLRGYAYQVAVSALAWLDVGETQRIYLEVAEDYAIVADNVLTGVQVKDTAASGSVTLNTQSVRDAIHAFVDLVDRNPGREVELRYFTTSPIGTERRRADQPADEAGLVYWRKVASGANIEPLRSILNSDNFSVSVQEYVRTRNDDALRADLLRKIHWDCGQPDIALIKRELEERLIVIGRDRFQLPFTEAKRLADVLMYRVLQKCIVKNANERVLTRADLYSIIDGVTRLTVPRAAVDTMVQFAASAFTGALVGNSPGAAFATRDIGWLIVGKDLPVPRFIISRPELEAAISKALEAHGFVVLVGGTGLGKSLVARAIAAKHGGGFAIADLRDTNRTETRHRLDSLLGCIGGLASRYLVVEDLDHFDDVGVSLSLGCIVEALRRRDRVGLVTTHRRPSARTLLELGLDTSDVVEVRYFSEVEAMEIVRATGGDPKIWGRLSYVAGANGHPQLVHAFAFGMAALRWPKEAVRDIVSRGFTSDDIDAARDAARRSLTAAIQAGTRMLLYRLSLIIGRFDRALALGIASLTPAIDNAGERLDELVGPWIEALGKGYYRVSPLTSNAGCETLTTDEQRSIHDLIATQLLERRTINASDATVIFAHAVAGKSTRSLSTLAYMVMTTESDSLSLLSEHFFLLRFMRTDQLIYPDSPAVSRMLRLAQLKLVAQTKESSDISDCVAALLNEIEHEPDSESRTAFESLMFAVVLIIPGIADHLVTWIDLLYRFKKLVAKNPELQSLIVNVEKASDWENRSFFGTLFMIGATGISSVARLEEVVDEIDSLSAEERAMWLRDYDRKPGDYGVFVNGPWLAEHNRKAINPADAAERYKRMAERTLLWDVRELAVRCHAARAVMLDEYGNDKEAALRALDEGVVALGENIDLSRERAKILWRHDDHTGAVEILRGIADLVGLDEPVERAFAMREAAISAARTSDWRQAEIWFTEGQTAAATVDTVDMQAIAIGLGADAAVAAVKIGERERALKRLADALLALKSLDPAATLRAAYCHHVVRHAVLWTQSQLQSREIKIDSEPIGILPGTCSNSEPLAVIRERPLAPLDLAWYMLAETEIISGVDVGIAKTLHTKLVQGPIPIYECSLRNQRMERAIARLDPVDFAEHLHGWLDGIAYLHANGENLRATFDVLSPIPGEIPSLPQHALAADELQVAAIDASLAFCIVAALKDEGGAIADLEGQLTGHFGNEFPGSALFKYWYRKPISLGQLNEICAKTIQLLRAGEHIEPKKLWEMGLRLFEKASQSILKLSTTLVVAGWLRAQWTRVVAQERFRLLQPRVTVPAIEAALANENNDASFVAALLLATSDAVGAPLTMAYRDQLTSVVCGAISPDPK